MSIGAPRFILLTGSPLRGSLNWEEDVLTAALLPAFQEVVPNDRFKRIDSSNDLPAWRLLHLTLSHLPTGLTQRGQPDRAPDIGIPTTHNNDCITAWQNLISTDAGADLNEIGSLPADVTGLWEHSLIVHDEVPSSQLLEPQNSSGTLGSVYSQEYSSESEDRNALRYENPSVRTHLERLYISDLVDMPNVSYLRSINPQTMTVNLVVGIISVSHPRRIQTRRGRRLVDLVELVVGDNTASGFGINIWLPVLPSAQDTDRTRDIDGWDSKGLQHRVTTLRPRDIILTSRVALSSFRGVVYGQSLRKGMTTIDLLHRQAVSTDDESGPYSTWEDGGRKGEISEQQSKVEKTSNWVLQFVAGPRVPAEAKQDCNERDSIETHLTSLPGDTQP